MRPKSSKMWQYFIKINEKEVKCNLCDEYIKSYSNTTTMIRHWKKEHKKSVTEQKKKDNKLKSKLSMKRKRSHQLKRNNADNTDTSHAGAGTSDETAVEIHEKSLSTQMSTSPIVATFDSNSDDDCQAQMLDAILYFICADYQSFNTVECKGFKYLMKKLAPLYKIPNKNAIKRRLDEKYDIVAQIFKQKLNETSHVTITIDTWSEAESSRNFLGIMVHFVSNGTTKIESGNIEVVELFESTEYIVREILSILTKWKININKVVAVVTNNESNIVNAVIQIFGQDKHIICFVHTINSVAENSIKNCEGFNDLVNKVKSVLKFVNSSTDLTKKLRQIDLSIYENAIKVILDIEMKWNNVFYMIKLFFKLWNIINEDTKHETLEMPTADELVTLKEIVDLLKPLKFMTQECLAENYITISKIIPLINCTMAEYHNTKQTMALSAKLKEIILAELKRWFSQILFINPSFSIATILDPRFKTVYFQNAQDQNALINAIYLLHDMIDKLSNSSDESDRQEETKYNLWSHHELLTCKLKEKDKSSLTNELSLYLANPLASLKDNPLEKWQSMKKLYPSLYIIAVKFLSIVATSVPTERFSKTGIATAQSGNRLIERLNKLLFLNSVNQEYWF